MEAMDDKEFQLQTRKTLQVQKRVVEMAIAELVHKGILAQDFTKRLKTSGYTDDANPGNAEMKEIMDGFANRIDQEIARR